MKILRSENGNALVITIIVLVLSTVIGLSLISMTLNGLTRNETREDMNQATQQAEKGISYISKHVEQEVEQILPKPVVGPGGAALKEQFNKDFNNILENHYCSKSDKAITNGDENMGYSVCLEDLSDIEKNKDDEPKTLTFRSTGYADGKEKTIRSTFTIGVKYENYPDALNNAVITHSGGNLILNGGIDIKGPVIADGNIVVSDRGYAPVIDKSGSIFKDLKLDSNPWKETVYPQIDGTLKMNSDTNKKLFVMNNDKFYFGCERPNKLQKYFKDLNFEVKDYFTYYDLLSYDFNNPNKEGLCLFDIKDKSSLPNYLTYPKKTTIEETTSQEPIDVKALVAKGREKLRNEIVKPDSYYSEKISGNVYYDLNASKPTELKGGFIDNLLKDRITVKGDYKVSNVVSSITDFHLKGNFYFAGAVVNLSGISSHKKDNIFEGKFYFDKPDSFLNHASVPLDIHGGKQTFNGEFYVNRTEEPTSDKVADDFDNAVYISGGEHEFQGIYYIDGDVKIYNSTINANAVFYVNGDVQIERSYINSLNGGKLVIFASNNIYYQYSSELGGNIGKDYYNEEPKEINAFFYAGNKVELHGTLSNIYIKGGVAAKQILLSGLRGEVTRLPLELKDNKNKDATSRLRIEYDKNVVNTIQEIQNQYGEDVSVSQLELQPMKQISREIQ